MKILPMIRGERAWKAADRACGAPELRGDGNSRAHFDAIRDAGPTWAEIDEEAFSEALDVLPPRYFPGGFAVSEAVCDDHEGRVMYLCVVTKQRRHFARYAHIVKGLADEVQPGSWGVPDNAPKTGQPCACKPGVQRDNCPACEGTGQVVDFGAIRARREASS